MRKPPDSVRIINDSGILQSLVAKSKQMIRTPLVLFDTGLQNSHTLSDSLERRNVMHIVCQNIDVSFK